MTNDLCRHCKPVIQKKYGGRQVYIPKGGGVDPTLVLKLRKQKHTIRYIAAKVGVGDRRVFQILAMLKRQGA